MSKIIIGIQGDVGSTNERACKFFVQKHGWKDFEIKYLISTENVLKALNEGKIDYGTFAWKTSREGLVAETQQAIKNYDYQKVDEEDFQLDHVILKNSDVDLNESAKIYSHPQALKEHGSFLESYFEKVELIEEVDTAIAAKKLSDSEYPSNSMIIAPKSCADLYNLDVFLDEIPSNNGYFVTIFLVKK